MKTERLTEKKTIHAALSFTTLHIEMTPIGEDISILLWGGDKPHIGCSVLAVPRPSLTGDGSASCTSSVLNVTGHRDEELCRMLAERVCKTYRSVVSCSGGFHVDEIRLSQIQEVMETVSRMKLD